MMKARPRELRPSPSFANILNRYRPGNGLGTVDLNGWSQSVVGGRSA
jgi:hypothetical protein